MRKTSELSKRFSSGVSGIAILAIIVMILILVSGGAYYYLAQTPMTNTSSTSSTISSSTPPSTSSSRSALILYSADAYVNESTVLANAFTQSSGIQIAPPKAAGSSALGQQIAQGNPVSIFISVSKAAVQNTTLKNESSGWAISFATDQMGIAYSSATNQSSAGQKVIAAYRTAVASNSTRDWYNFYSNLTSGQVKIGISNPNADPAGFRAWLVLEAAGKTYANSSSYFVNKMVTNGGNITAASAADLVAPLQTGNIQFLFIYKSDISAEHLGLLQLPSSVNLGAPSYNTFYSQFTYTTTGGVQKGSAIVLWVTVPKDSTNYVESVQFVIFLIRNYQPLLKPFGLAYINPPKMYNDTSSDVPTSLQQLISNGTLSYGGVL